MQGAQGCCIHKAVAMAPKKQPSLPVRDLVGRGSNKELKRVPKVLKKANLLSNIEGIDHAINDATNNLAALEVEVEITTTAAARANDTSLGATSKRNFLEPNRLLAHVNYQ